MKKITENQSEQKPVPFNDALKRVWAAPPAPKATKPAAKTKKKTGK